MSTLSRRMNSPVSEPSNSNTLASVYQLDQGSRVSIVDRYWRDVDAFRSFKLLLHKVGLPACRSLFLLLYHSRCTIPSTILPGEMVYINRVNQPPHYLIAVNVTDTRSWSFVVNDASYSNRLRSVMIPNGYNSGPALWPSLVTPTATTFSRSYRLRLCFCALTDIQKATTRNSIRLSETKTRRWWGKLIIVQRYE